MADFEAIVKSEQNKLGKVLESAQMYIDRDYLAYLSAGDTVAVPQGQSDFSQIRIIHLKKLVYNTEDIHNQILSLFHTLSGISQTCFLQICGDGSETNIYLGIYAPGGSTMAENALKFSIDGNFPGTEYVSLNKVECMQVLQTMHGQNNTNNTSVVSVSQIPSMRGSTNGLNNFTQGIERFIDSMKGEKYTAIIVANPLSSADAASQRNSLENIYSSLSSLGRLSYQYSENQSVSEQRSLTTSVTDSITESITAGYSYGTMQNSGTTKGGAPNIHAQFSKLGLGYGLQRGSFQSSGTQQGFQQQQGSARQKGIQTGQGVTQGEINGQSSSLTITQINKSVEDLLERVDCQIKRIIEGETYGLWECCAYFAAPTLDIALVAANVYKALSCGSNTGNTMSYMNSWDSQRPQDVSCILSSLANARMPVFKLKSGHLCNAGLMISGNELPMIMNFPRKSVCGVSVVKMALFGRDVYYSSQMRIGTRAVRIGKVQHMGRVENTPVKLDIDNLTSHALITGTTGVGKSTLMAMLLSALYKAGVKMLVVEPVKGEYKELLGGIPGIEVFTVNPYKSRMLRINPFEFRDNIHVLSHIDRLIEVFSVCWPLYAAQPALLRECIEEAYIQSGWDLSNSIYMHEGPTKYPNFELLLKIVPEIINKSHFVGESKGTYEGALLTRIAMLTNGIYGQVFNGKATLSDEDLFERNTIIDLSDVGSQETISLLMGVLVVRLREYRTSKNKPDNRPLHHVMVLEEAHNIFQSKSDKNSEGGENISGKSVQMLSECIAEMRGYGQGIFIVDQSPGEIDIAGIRNTATKIVMRLPEASDQRAVSESLSLSDAQMLELSRLPEQVAIIYQTGWLEPVMVRLNTSKREFFKSAAGQVTYRDIQAVRGFLSNLILKMESARKYDCSMLIKALSGINNFSEEKKADYQMLFAAFDTDYQYYKSQFTSAKVRIAFFSRLMTELLSAEEFFRLCPLPNPRKDATKPYINDKVFAADCVAWEKRASNMLEKYASNLSVQEKKETIQLLLLNNAKMPRQITVHNVLFGKIAD